VELGARYGRRAVAVAIPQRNDQNTIRTSFSD